MMLVLWDLKLHVEDGSSGCVSFKSCFSVQSVAAVLAVWAVLAYFSLIERSTEAMLSDGAGGCTALN